MGDVYLQLSKENSETQSGEAIASPLLRALLRYLREHGGTLISHKEQSHDKKTDNR
jgi:hypothetical protein